MLQQQSAANPARLQRALEGLRRYQEAPRQPPPPLMPAIAARGGASLRDYGGSGLPLVVVPSLINPPTILDLSPERSLLRWLGRRGRRVLLLDWGWPGPERAAMSISDHVEHLLCPIIRDLKQPFDLAGYCLGGTMALAAACLVPVRRLVLIAAPWHFAAYGESGEALMRLWEGSRVSVDALGLMPMELLQTAFWNLDPARTVDKYVDFAGFPAGSAQEKAFVTLEDWANDGPPLPAAAARQLFEQMFGEDRSGSGAWRVAGRTIRPEALSIPTLNIASSSDRIVPAASAAPLGDRLLLEAGHVGMIIGSRAEQSLWTPLADWLSRTAA